MLSKAILIKQIIKEEMSGKLPLCNSHLFELVCLRGSFMMDPSL